jgi:hypothetical protein
MACVRAGLSTAYLTVAKSIESGRANMEAAPPADSIIPDGVLPHALQRDWLYQTQHGSRALQLLTSSLGRSLLISWYA